MKSNKPTIAEILEAFREALLLLFFAAGLFRSTPESRARKALRVKQREERQLLKRQENWRKDRLKYAKELRKDVTEKRITPEEYKELMEVYDKDYPQPE